MDITLYMTIIDEDTTAKKPAENSEPQGDKVISSDDKTESYEKSQMGKPITY